MPKVLFEIRFHFQPVWLLMLAVLLIFAFAAGEAWRKYHRYGEKTDKNVAVFTTLIVFFIIGLEVFIASDQIRMYRYTVAAYQRGDYQTVEGYVENFEPSPHSGSDSFTVGCVRFSYGPELSWGYHTKMDAGGVITHNGQRLRIRYVNYAWLGNVILYIEELPQIGP